MTSAIGQDGLPAWQPRRVFLFSGHMIDAPDRPVPRFPAAATPIAKQAIEMKLDRLDANATDLAISSGACGGDLLFAQACLDRAVPLLMYLPFSESEFLQRSVLYAGEHWRAAFFCVERNPNTTTVLVPDDAGAASPANAYERVNLRQLEVALSYGAERLRFICLWNGKRGDGPGGTQHLVHEVKRHAGHVHWLDTRKLWRV